MSNQSDDEFETGDAGGPTGGGGPGEMSAPGGVGGPRGLGGPAGLDGGQMPPGKVRQIWSCLAGPVINFMQAYPLLQLMSIKKINHCSVSV